MGIDKIKASTFPGRGFLIYNLKNKKIKTI